MSIKWVKIRNKTIIMVIFVLIHKYENKNVPFLVFLVKKETENLILKTIKVF